MFRFPTHMPDGPNHWVDSVGSSRIRQERRRCARGVTEGVEVVRQGDPVVPVGDVTTITRGDDEHGTEPLARDGVEQVTAHAGVVQGQRHKVASAQDVVGPTAGDDSLAKASDGSRRLFLIEFQ